jgi:hypothetical protein
MCTVVLGIAGFQATEHQAGGVIVRLIDFHHLETTLQGGVALEVLFVFRPGGGRDGTQFATRQRRFQQVGGICAARLVARADDGVRFVDKQQHRGRGLLHRIDDVFQPLFELALHARTRLQQAEVKGAQSDRFQRFRHIAFGNTQRQTFNQCGFAHARLADQDRVVLRRRERISTIWRISVSRPNTGSIFLPLWR